MRRLTILSVVVLLSIFGVRSPSWMIEAEALSMQLLNQIRGEAETEAMI